VVTGSFPTGERAHKHEIEESKARDRQIPCSFEQIRAFCVLFGVFGAFGVLSGRFSEWFFGRFSEWFFWALFGVVFGDIGAFRTLFGVVSRGKSGKTKGNA